MAQKWWNAHHVWNGSTSHVLMCLSIFLQIENWTGNVPAVYNMNCILYSYKSQMYTHLHTIIITLIIFNVIFTILSKIKILYILLILILSVIHSFYSVLRITIDTIIIYYSYIYLCYNNKDNTKIDSLHIFYISCVISENIGIIIHVTDSMKYL